MVSIKSWKKKVNNFIICINFKGATTTVLSFRNDYKSIWQLELHMYVKTSIPEHNCLQQVLRSAVVMNVKKSDNFVLRNTMYMYSHKYEMEHSGTHKIMMQFSFTYDYTLSCDHVHPNGVHQKLWTEEKIE